MTTQHIAAPVVDGVQRCARCGLWLQTDSSLRFEAYTLIYVDGVTILADEPPDWTPCAEEEG